MFLQPCVIILGIFAWYAQAASQRMVDCERYPFHSTCRGTMSKKSGIRSNGLREDGCEDFNEDGPCSDAKAKPFEERRRITPFHNGYGTFPRSRLWIGLLNKGLNADALYDAFTSNYERHHRKRKNDEGKYNERTIRFPDMQPDFLSVAETLGNDY